MPSSTSSFKTDTLNIPLRDVPEQNWGKAFIIALIIMVIGVGAWEVNMRMQGLTTDDIDDGNGYWSYERRKLDEAKPNQIAIIGASRILFDTSLDIFEEITGERPVQLALAGTAPYIFLEDLANDPDFTGLVVLGYAPGAIMDNHFFYVSLGALDFYKNEGPSKRFGHVLQVMLNRVFAFMEVDKRLFNEINQREVKNRPGLPDIYVDQFKFDVTYEDRQTYLWDKLMIDETIHRQIVGFWKFFISMGIDNGSIPKETVDGQIAFYKASIDKIRAKGGDVVFVRSPSTGFVKESEAIMYPRDVSWERMIAETNSIGFHYEDHDAVKDMIPPELSHLKRSDAEIFTRTYVTYLMEQLKARD